MPKKQPFQKITNRELEIMQLLWNADHPLIASEIAAAGKNYGRNFFRVIQQRRFL